MLRVRPSLLSAAPLPLPLPLPLRLERGYTTAMAQSSAVHAWAESVRSNVHVQHDRVDVNRVRQLALCLPAAVEAVPGYPSQLVPKGDAASVREGDKLVPGGELVLFNPLLHEGVLAADGTERTFGPPGGLDQRMWASGTLEWHAGPILRVGDPVSCHVSVDKVEPKTGAKTGPMVLVWRRLVYSNPHGTVTTERRCHVYRAPVQRAYSPPPSATEPTQQRQPQPQPHPHPHPQSEPEYSFGWDYNAHRATLFRYSAATFNAHRIHLDPEYCRQKEGHPDCLVHGPLTATLLMNLADRASDKRLRSFEYRATAPLVVEQTVRLRGQWRDRRQGKVDLWALDERGTVCMKASALVE